MLNVGDSVIVRNPYKGFPTYLKDKILRLDDLGVILYSGMCFSDISELKVFDETIYQELLAIDEQIKELKKLQERLVIPF